MAVEEIEPAADSSKTEFAGRCETNLHSFVLTADDGHARCGHRGEKAEPFENLRSECNGKSHTCSDRRNDSTRDDCRNGTGGRKNEQRTARRINHGSNTRIACWKR
jgi:hypothetical protein